MAFAPSETRKPSATSDKRSSARPARDRKIALARHLPFLSIGLVLALLAAWQWLLPAFNFTGIPLKYLGAPSQVWTAFKQVVAHGYSTTTLQGDIVASIIRVVLGFAIGASIAMVIGLLIGYYRFFDQLLSPLFNFLRPIPAIAFIPIVVIWLGIGELPMITVVAWVAFIFSVISVSSGVRNVPAVYLKVADNFGISRRDRFIHVALPAALPYIIPGLRTAMALSWAVVVTAELIAAQNGLGHLIIDASNFFQVNIVYVGVFFIGAIGYLMDLGFRLLNARFVHWAAK